MRIHGLFLSFISIAGIGVAAQTPLKFADSSAPLNGPWMFFPGDNPGWAQPGLDDSQWTPMDLTVKGGESVYGDLDDFLPGWTARGFPSLSGYAWYRLSVRPKDPSQDLWLLMPNAVDDGYEVYANGQFLGGLGDIRPGHLALFRTRSLLFHLPPAGADGMLHLAIRMYMSPMTALTDLDAGGLHAPPVMGLRADLQTMFAEKQDVSLRGQISGPIVALPELLFGCLALALFLVSRHRKVYLWLGLCGLITAYNNVFGMVSALTFNAALDSSFTQDNITFILTRMLWLFFWVWWFGLEKRRYLWVSGIAVCAANLVCLETMLLPAAQAMIPRLHLVTVAARVLLAALPIASAAMGIRKNREGWLTLPALLAMGVGLFTNELTLLHMPIVYYPFGIQVWLSQLSSLACFTLSGALLIRRFMRELRAHTQLQNEVHSAQQVQQMLVPNELEPLENFAVEAVYVPASEVGGDFFQVIPCSDGSLLAVIGDVSGKGIPAAMVVALIVGTLRTAIEFTKSPASLLGMLNEQLCGRLKSGFATCAIVLVSPAGDLDIANAAHLSPYINGEEIALEPQVPLGISESAYYRTDRRRLNPGDRLTFVSDGVVEARRHSGELFGFDRTREISQRPAQEIVDAAKAFGQDDDITVLTVCFEGAARTAMAMA